MSVKVTAKIWFRASDSNWINEISLHIGDDVDYTGRTPYATRELAKTFLKIDIVREIYEAFSLIEE